MPETIQGFYFQFRVCSLIRDFWKLWVPRWLGVLNKALEVTRLARRSLVSAGALGWFHGPAGRKLSPGYQEDNLDIRRGFFILFLVQRRIMYQNMGIRMVLCFVFLVSKASEPLCLLWHKGQRSSFGLRSGPSAEYPQSGCVSTMTGVSDFLKKTPLVHLCFSADQKHKMSA